ncbi:MAG TPA: phospholipid carrier-dependent glycosyltransferase [Anaerolineales bacterium]|nr:phospholipid carrier-dependent glycosyltransferase [Anaerolineales bacterium]
MDRRAFLRLASFLGLLLLAIIGTLLILRATPEGLGLSDDSIAYIAGARSLLAGQGYREAWLASNQPVTHFPPGFSSVLAFFGLFGPDPLHAARFVNALLFGLNAALLGILAWRMTPSLTAGLVLAALFVASGEMLQVHAVAMSEPLFIFLTLLSLWMFDLYFERHHHWLWLILCATLVGMAYLTRYAALALVTTFVAALLILHTNWHKRLTSVGIFLTAVLPWILGWAIRNRLVAENATNRVLAWHPITPDNLRMGLRVVSDFFIPVDAWRQAVLRVPGMIEGMVLLVFGSVLVWVSVSAWKYLSKPPPAPVGERIGKAAMGVIAFTTGLFILAYLASLVMSMTFFDAATKFRLRILSPMFVGLLILLVYFGVWLRTRHRPVVIVLTILVLSLSVYKQSITVNNWHKSELGYASFKWYDSKAMAFLRDLPEGIRIYTNEPAAVYLYTGRGALVLPDRIDSTTALARSGFEEGVAYMQSDINAGNAVLVLFDEDTSIPEDAPILSEGLYLAHKSAGDSIYTAEP